MCVGNTADTGCFLSAACTPCPVPANGIAICTAQGTCSVMCNPGYVPNATNTDCDPIPPPMECCDDNECPIFTICLGGYCQSPFGGMCDPAKCTEFCQCAVGGSPQSVGMCVLDVIFWTCECSP